MIRCLPIATALATLAGAAQAEYALTILHTNDFHSRFEPINGYDSTCSEEEGAQGACFGGTARLVTAIREARDAAQGATLLLDGGDQFQGTLFYTYYKGSLAAEMMNRLGYDAMTVGNHEFDDGPEVLAEFAGAIDFPILMSNADMSGEPALADAIRPATVIETGGARIGLVGLTPEDTGELSSPGPNVSFSDPVAAVQAEVDRLTGEGVDKIVVLSHSGYGMDQRLARETKGVDVIVGGHSHTLLGDMKGAAGPYPTMVNGVPVVQAYSYGKYLGELQVTFDDAGNVTGASGAPRLLDASVAEDQESLGRIREAAEPLNEIREEVVAEAGSEILGARDECRARECPMGNLIADAMLARVEDQGIVAAIQNGGGIRASIDAGPVTMAEVLTVLPFQNTLSTFEVDGAALQAALENGVSQIEEGAGRFPQVAGMTFTVDPSAEPGGRISDVTVGGEPLDRQATYGLVSNNFVRNGGDGYSMFVDAANAYDYGPDLAEVTAEYMAGIDPVEPGKDGRITVTGE